MDEEQLARWNRQLDEALGSGQDTDLQPLWDAVCAAIAAEPGHAGLRRLRIRMAEAFYEHAIHHEDLLALRGIDDAIPLEWLELALAQHRWAFNLVEDDAPDKVDALQREALAWLAAMVRQHRADADFCDTVLARWSDAAIYAPWLRLTLVLELAAAHPEDDRFARALAFAWEDLANQSPEGHDPESGALPMGFMVDAQGMLWDPFLQERALSAIAALIEREPRDEDLLNRRARLLEARCDFPAAAAAYEDAGAPERAQVCRGGRGAITADLVLGMEQAVAQLQQPTPPREGASPAALAAIAELDASLRESYAQISGEIDKARAAFDVPPLDDEKREELREVARQVAAQILASVQLAPLEIAPIGPGDFEEDWAGAQAAVTEVLAARGWHPLGWAEWPAFRDMLGHQAVSSAWTAADGATTAWVFVARDLLSIDLETSLGDGTIVASSLSRGRNFLAGSPEVDILFVEPSLPVEDACALHAARVAFASSRPHRPALQPSGDFATAAAHQERGRQLKTAFRLEHGLTESESLGVPSDLPEVFAPLLREEVLAGVSALRSATRLR